MSQISKPIILVAILFISTFNFYAQERQTGCSVELDVEFLDSGYISKVLPITNNCTSEKAIGLAVNKAKQIQFDIAQKEGKPVKINKHIEYKLKFTGDEAEIISETQSMIILDKPKAKYPKDNGNICVQGTVILQIVFLSTGQIGEIKAVRTLPYGLTEEAIKAAKNMKFIPLIVNGESENYTKMVQFSFSIY